MKVSCADKLKQLLCQPKILTPARSRVRSGTNAEVAAEEACCGGSGPRRHLIGEARL